MEEPNDELAFSVPFRERTPEGDRQDVFEVGVSTLIYLPGVRVPGRAASRGQPTEPKPAP